MSPYRPRLQQFEAAVSLASTARKLPPVVPGQEPKHISWAGSQKEHYVPWLGRSHARGIRAVGLWCQSACNSEYSCGIH